MSPAPGDSRRAVLIHWKAEEGAARLTELRAAGWDAECITPDGSVGLGNLRAHPPHAIVIDFTRLPSQGRAVGEALRRYKQTRHVPLVFVGGATDKVESLRAALPDAIYTDWPSIATALSDAVRCAPDQPVVPAPMEGYSGTPLPKKLGIKPGLTVSMLHPPQGFTARLDLPEGVQVHRRLSSADRVLLFLRSSADLKKWFEPAGKALKGNSGLWLIWPKKTSGIETDLNETMLRAYAMQRGWVDFKVCAVDATWSGLQFARRRD